VPDATDRDRAITAYAAEVRATHTLFGAVLLALAAFHLLVAYPLYQVRAALPAVGARARALEEQITAAEQAQQTVAAATAAVAQFRRMMAAAPEQLRHDIAALVARGRTLVGPNGDPYRATIRVPREGASPGGPTDEEVTVAEAVRRQIGRQMDALGLSFERALEPIRNAGEVPAGAAEILRQAQDTVSRQIQVDLNKVLQDAFSAEPNFWLRWDRPASFGTVSVRADEVARSIDTALSDLLDRLAKTAIQTKAQQQVLRTRLETTQATHRALTERADRIAHSVRWAALAPEETMRLYPIVAGVLSLMALFRVRRLLALRRGLAGVDVEQFAPSWLLGAAGAPGRLWSMVLLAAPLAAAIHGAAVVLADPGVFVNALGEASPLASAGYAVAYAVLILTGLWQLALVARAVLAPPKRAAHGGR
jgi:hypothetical protein